MTATDSSDYDDRWNSGSGYHVPMGMLDIFPMADGSKAVNDDGEAINGTTVLYSSRIVIRVSITRLLSPEQNGDMIRMQMP